MHGGAAVHEGVPVGGCRFQHAGRAHPRKLHYTDNTHTEFVLKDTFSALQALRRVVDRPCRQIAKTGNVELAAHVSAT